MANHNTSNAVNNNITTNDSHENWLDNQIPWSEYDFNTLLAESKLFPRWKFTFLYHIMKVLSSAIISMNVYTLLLLIRRRKLRTKANALLANLAFIDLIVGAVCVPLFIVSQEQVEEAFYKTYIRSLSLYLTTKIIIHTTSLLTISNFFVVIAERFVSIRFPFRHIRWLTGYKIEASLITMWVFAISYSILSLFIYWPIFHFGDLNNFSSILRLSAASVEISIQLDKYKLEEIYCSFLVLFTILSAILLLTMFIHIQKRPIQPCARASQIFARKKKELKALKTLSVMGVTVIIWLSPTVYAYIGDHEKLQYVALYLGRFVISLTNPIIFTLYKKDFREVVNQDLSRMKRFLCTVRLKITPNCNISNRCKTDQTSDRG